MRIGIILIVIIILPVNEIMSQEPTKAGLERLFKKSIEQDSRKSISTYSHPWFIDNKNDSYYKSDTITLVSFITSDDLEFCNTVNWTFYQKDKFVLTKAQHCKEPPSIEVSEEDDWFSVEISDNSSGLFIGLYNKKQFMCQFKVFRIEKEIDRIKIKLVRMHK